MRPTFDKLSQDAPTILNGTNEYEYVLVGTFHSVHTYHSCPPFPIQLFGWGSYPLEYLCMPKISHRADQGDAALSGGTRRATVAGFSLNLFCRNEFISPPAEHIVREIDGTPLEILAVFFVVIGIAGFVIAHALGRRARSEIRQTILSAAPYSKTVQRNGPRKGAS